MMISYITFQIENKFKRALNLILWNSQLIFHIIWRSHFIFSHENHWVTWSLWIGNIFEWNSNIFRTLLILFKWKKSCHLLSRVSWWKVFEFTESIKAKMKVWESPFIPSHLAFKKFRIHSLSDNQSNKQSIYLFIITFQNLEFWDVTNLPPLKWISSSRFGEASKK